MDEAAAQDIVCVLAAVLQKLTDANDHRTDTGRITKFHALRAPSITVQAYLERIAKYANCSGECFVLALVYIDRLIQRNNFIINSLNVHRIVITSVMLGAKFFDDHYYNNTYYAKIGGVPRNEMNLLELEFLFLINFSLYLDPDEYRKYHDELRSEHTRAAMLTPPVADFRDAPSGEFGGGRHIAAALPTASVTAPTATAPAVVGVAFGTGGGAFAKPTSVVAGEHPASYAGRTSAMDVEARNSPARLTSTSTPMTIETNF